MGKCTKFPDNYLHVINQLVASKSLRRTPKRQYASKYGVNLLGVSRDIWMVTGLSNKYVHEKYI